MSITQDKAINEVLNGHQALSMGYTCELEKAEPGACFMGVEYDYIQKNIRYNHCAIVGTARAGDIAKIRLDSQDAILIEKLENGGIPMSMKKINLDGLEYEGEEKLVASYIEQKKRADSLETELATVRKDSADALSAVEAERDTFKEQADTANEALKDAEAKMVDEARIDGLVEEKLSLIKNAESAGVEIKNDMSSIDIKKAVVLATFPKANFDGKDDVYINARYDASLEVIAEKNNVAITVAGAEPTVKTDSASSREKMIDAMRNRA